MELLLRGDLSGDHLPARHPTGGRLGLPADFLIAGDGRVVARKYGEHVYDQWPVDELLRLVARVRRPAPELRPPGGDPTAV